MSSDDLEKWKSGVKRKVIVITGIATAVTAVAYYKFPLKLPPMSTVSERLAFTLQWNALPVGVVFSMIHVIGNTRLNSGQINPLSTVDKDKVEIHARVLTNTIEQFVLSFALQLSTTCWLEEQQMKVIPITVLLFVVGRLLFWKGYLNPAYGRTSRAYGLPLTMFPSASMLIYCMFKLAKSCCNN